MTALQFNNTTFITKQSVPPSGQQVSLHPEWKQQSWSSTEEPLDECPLWWTCLTDCCCGDSCVGRQLNKARCPSAWRCCTARWLLPPAERHVTLITGVKPDEKHECVCKREVTLFPHRVFRSVRWFCLSSDGSENNALVTHLRFLYSKYHGNKWRTSSSPIASDSKVLQFMTAAHLKYYIYTVKYVWCC